jgi:hypothetical protein
MNLVKILNADNANKLATLGFKYTKEKIGDRTCYVFIQTNDLMKQLNTSFSKKDFFIDKTMNF